MRFSQT